MISAPLHTAGLHATWAAKPKMALGGGSFSGMAIFRIPHGPRMEGVGPDIGGDTGGDDGKAEQIAKLSDGSGSNAGNGGGNNGKVLSVANPSDDDDESSPFFTAWKSYEQLLEEKALCASVLISASSFFLGDLIAQLVVQQQQMDWARLLRLTSFGLMLHGPTAHYWKAWIQRWSGTGAKALATKILIEQLIWAPGLGVALFLYVGLLETGNMQHAALKLRQRFALQLTGSWKVWPIAHVISSRLPAAQGMLYMNSVQIAYSGFLSVISSFNGYAP